MGEIKDKAEEFKGRAKEAAGDVIGDHGLEREGQLDRAAAEAKQKLGHAKEKISEAIDKAKEKLADEG